MTQVIEAQRGQSMSDLSPRPLRAETLSTVRRVWKGTRSGLGAALIVPAETGWT